MVFIPGMHTRLRHFLSIISGLLRLTCLSDRLFTSFDPIWETWTHSSLPHGCVRVSVLPAPGFSVAAVVWEAPWPTLSPQMSALEVQGSTLWWISKEIACVFLHSPAGSQPHRPSGDSVVAKHGALRSAVDWSPSAGQLGEVSLCYHCLTPLFLSLLVPGVAEKLLPQGLLCTTMWKTFLFL